MSFLSRLVQRNLSLNLDAVAGREGLALPGVENGALEMSPQPSRTGTLPQAKTLSTPSIQRQPGLEIEDQAEEQVARTTAADKPFVDTKPRTPAESLEKENSDIARSQASSLGVETSPENLSTAELSGAPLGVQRMEKVASKEIVSPKRIVPAAVGGPKKEATGATVQRKVTPQKTAALGSPQAPSKSPGLGEVAPPPIPKSAFLGKPQNAPDNVAPGNALKPVKEPVLADKGTVVPEAAKGTATPVPDVREMIPNTYKQPESSGGLVAHTPRPKDKPTVIIERIDIHVIDEQGTGKEPRADPLLTPLDAYYLRSL